MKHSKLFYLALFPLLLTSCGNEPTPTPTPTPGYIPVTSITTMEPEFTLEIGEEHELQYEIKPENATYKSVITSTSSTNIALEGTTVTALSSGEATIVLETVDGGYTLIYTVTVNDDEPVLQEIEITGDYKPVYFVGEEFDPTDLVVMAIYDEGEPVDVTSECEFSGFDSSEVGIITITATYKDKSADFEVAIEEKNPTKGVVTFKLGSKASETPKGYFLSFNHDNEYFTNSAKVLNNDLKKLSYGVALCNLTAKSGEYFYTAMGYEDYLSEGYDEESFDKVSYSIAHKNIGDYDLVALSIRGQGYGTEWANNFIIGKEGNHKGFDECANKIYDTLKEYISSYSTSNFKLWVSGYSRGGAIANVLASKLLKERNEIEISQDNLFVYTYEAPNALTLENAVKYENVFNFITEKDFVPNVAPSKYELYRCGVDISIDEGKDIDECFAKFDPEVTLPKFTPVSPEESSGFNYASEEELVDKLMDVLVEDVELDVKHKISTRELYADTFEDEIAYFFEVFMSLDDETYSDIIAKAKALDMSKIFTMITTESGIYNFIEPILREHEFPYDEAKLTATCDAARDLIQSKASFFISNFVDFSSMSLKQNRIDSVMRCAYIHFPEVIYSLVADL